MTMGEEEEKSGGEKKVFEKCGGKGSGSGTYSCQKGSMTCE